MVLYTMLAVPADKRLIEVEPQPFFRGDLVIATDVRRDFLLISQSIPGIQAAIGKCCNQSVSLTSLHESSQRAHRKGLTGGAWSVTRSAQIEAIQQWNTMRSKFTHRVVAARRADAWKFE